MTVTRIHDPMLACLTDPELKAITRARYEASMLLQVNGGQYTTPQGCHRARLADEAYYEALAEMKHRGIVQDKES